MSYVLANEAAGHSKFVSLRPFTEESFENWKTSASDYQKKWLEDSGFKASAGQYCALPGDDGSIESWFFGQGKNGWLYQLSSLPTALPEGVYRLDSNWTREQRVQASLGWGLAGYRFDRYKANDKHRPELVLEEDIANEVSALYAAQSLVRDLINTPTEDMGPAQLADAVRQEADHFKADCKLVTGDELLSRDFPAIHAVGRASHRAPRLIELTWGAEDAPRLTLVGKGVCFDTGGLDLKAAAGMLLMKKDMGGAAHALALAKLVMEHKLPVRLRLLIPAVENSVAGNAYRPGDIIPTRKGLSVEIGNTDAEGRVILSDALAFACEEPADLVIDFATLTGAARIALGADLPPLFSNRAEVAQGMQQAGDEVEDPLWMMPLYQPYNKLIETPIADLCNSGKSAFAGCITAALFLEHFVDPEIPWVHIDTFGWNQADRPGRPQGGEALGLRAVFHYLQQRYS